MRISFHDSPTSYVRTCIITIRVCVPTYTYIHAERHAWDSMGQHWTTAFFNHVKSVLDGSRSVGRVFTGMRAKGLGRAARDACGWMHACMYEGARLAGLDGSWDRRAVTGFFACILPKRPMLTPFYGWLDPYLDFA